MKKWYKIVSWIVWIILLCLSIGAFYVFIIDKENIEIDRYNFEQLEIVDNIIMNDKKYDYAFRDIGEFNKIYKTKIQPIKNCYYIDKYNGDEKYLFWFKLESLLYKIKYKNSYIAYPKYDLPVKTIRLNKPSKLDHLDRNYFNFIEHISNPCDEDYL